MRILVTRPLNQAHATAAKIESRGHIVVIEPLLEVAQLSSPIPDGSFGGIILTSANALPSLAELDVLDQLLPLPVLTTGKATSKAALDTGFTKVGHHTGSAIELIGHLPQWMNQHQVSGRLLYPCAQKTAHDLESLLAEKQICCVQWPVYRTQPTDQFSQSTLQGLRSNDFDAVLLYSKRTAHTFVQLMRQNNIAMEGLHTYVMSQDIYEALPKELQEHAQYPDNPVETDLLNLFEP